MTRSAQRAERRPNDGEVVLYITLVHDGLFGRPRLPRAPNSLKTSKARALFVLTLAMEWQVVDTHDRDSAASVGLRKLLSESEFKQQPDKQGAREEKTM